MKKILVFVLVACCVYASRGVAQPTSGVAPEKPMNFGYVDSMSVLEAVPSDPVFDLLGLGAGQISQPGTTKALLTSISSARDAGGRLQPGYALTIAPYQMFFGKGLLYADYVSDFGTRVLSNLQLSAGIGPSRNQDSTSDVGIGVRVVLFNSGDGRLDRRYIDQLAEEYDRIFAMTKKANMKVGEKYTSEDSAADKKLLLSYDGTKDISLSHGSEAARVKAAEASHWTATYLHLDLGTVWRASESQLSKSMWDRYRVMVNGGYGIGILQANVQAGVCWRNTNAGFYAADSATTLVAALQVKFGSPTFRLGLGARAVSAGFSGQAFRQGDLAAALELKLLKDTWVMGSVTREIVAGAAPEAWKISGTIKTTLGADLLGLL